MNERTVARRSIWPAVAIFAVAAAPAVVFHGTPAGAIAACVTLIGGFLWLVWRFDNRQGTFLLLAVMGLIIVAILFSIIGLMVALRQ